MKTGLYTITPTQAYEILSPPARLRPFMSEARPLLVGFYDNEPVCLVGLCPMTLMSGAAYLWGWNTPKVFTRPLVYARWSRRLVAKALQTYPRLIGQCEPWKRKWLASLGATFEIDSTFTIEASR